LKKKIEQTSNLIKVPNRTIEGFENIVVSAVKINRHHECGSEEQSR
jgi:hypothetical protein